MSKMLVLSMRREFILFVNLVVLNLSCNRFYLNFSVRNMLRYLKFFFFFFIFIFSISFFNFFPFLKLILGERNIGGVTMEVVY